MEKYNHRRFFSTAIGKMEHISVFSLPRISSTSAHEIPSLHHHIHLLPIITNYTDTLEAMVISVVYEDV